jgi:hypothetical protein
VQLRYSLLNYASDWLWPICCCPNLLTSIAKGRVFIRIGYFGLIQTVLMEGVQSDLAAMHGVGRKFSQAVMKNWDKAILLCQIAPRHKYYKVP